MKDFPWELTLLDADPPVKALGSVGVGDVDGDGNKEIIMSGIGALLWYRPATFEHGIIDKAKGFGVGIALADIDHDGLLEVVSPRQFDQGTEVVWYKPQKNLSKRWSCHAIDPSPGGSVHDILFVDIDCDGKLELVANRLFCACPSVFIYKPKADPIAVWDKYVAVQGLFGEGLAVNDFNADAKLEIIHGPYLLLQPPNGPYSGAWKQTVFAPGFRDMCKVASVDISGNGRPDIVCVESEYLDGRIAWFENRMLESPHQPWVEHEIDRDVRFGHSLSVARNGNSIRVFVGEMGHGAGGTLLFDARLIHYITDNSGENWNLEVLSKGAGTHEAVEIDVDGDGQLEIVGHEFGEFEKTPKVQIWKRNGDSSFLSRFSHRIVDRAKPYTGTDIVSGDINGNGLDDIVCGAWWYKNPSWERFEIPGIYQVFNAYDIDGDGRKELIATKAKSGIGDDDWYKRLSSEMVWLKPVDPEKGRWKEYPIGNGDRSWPHGSVVAPVLPNGRLALIVGYHDACAKEPHYPELFEVPDDPRNGPWPQRVLTEIRYGGEFAAGDINGNGKVDLVAGTHWLENLGNGTFVLHKIAEDFKAARVCLADINGDGKLEAILSQETLDWENNPAQILYSLLAWFEQPVGSKHELWRMHVIDKVRCGHSLSIFDIDGDGEPEVICGEHHHRHPHHTRCRLLVYKKADPHARAWKRYVLDDRFEHHCGAKVISLASGRFGIISHGWKESQYIHLWE